MKLSRLWVLTTLLAVVALSACGPSVSPTATPKATTSSPAPTTLTAKPASTPASGAVSFAGKTITVVVPNPPGGSTDIIARMYTNFLPRFLPGRPSAIVRNIPGGNATIGANYVYASKPDGLTLLVSSGSLVGVQLLGLGGVKFDFLKMFSVVGNAEGGVFYTKPNVVDKAENVLTAKGLVYGGPTGSAMGMIFVCMKELAGLPVDKVVMAYSGVGDSRRAFLSGEVNVTQDSTSAYSEVVVPMVAKGEVVPLFQLGVLDAQGKILREPGLPPDIMTGEELYVKLMNKPPSGQPWDAYRGLLAGTRAYTRMLHLPPGTPDDIKRAYFEAAEKMIKDADFHKVADPMVGKNAPWGAGEAYDKQFKANFGMDPKVVEWLKDTLSKKYGVVVE